MKGYDTASYAATRLNETVIRKGLEPILVHSCTDGYKGIKVQYQYIVSGASGEDYLHNLNLDPVPLGYVNFNGNAIYLTRMPMRQDWKQGLRDRNITTADGFNNPLPYHVIANTIIGKFPTIKNCLERLNSSNMNTAMAFNRDFCVERSGNLKYKSLFDIGNINMDNANINIDDSFSWVREAFEECMENAA